MPPRLLAPAGLLLLGALTGGHSYAQAAGQAGEPSKELRAAPEPETPPAAPPEVALTPAPEAEKALLPPGFVEVRNPAFPLPPLEPPVVHRGRRFELADLAPYFAEGPLAAARAEFEAERHLRAFQLLEGAGDALPVRYLRALSALRAGNDAWAAPELERLATDYPPMRDRALTHAALAREELGQPAESARLYAQVPSTSRLYTDARLGLARALEKQGDVEAAIAALQPLGQVSFPGWGRNVPAEALAEIAELYRKQGDLESAAKILVELWSTQPLASQADQASRRLSGTELPLEARVARGEALVEAHRNRQGIAVLLPLRKQLQLPDPLACRAEFSLGKAYRKQREHPQAIKVLTPVVEQCTDPELRPRAMYVLGSSRSIVAADQGAEETYEALAREFPTHAFADDALFYAADLYLRNGKAELALERLAQLARAYPDGDFVSEALFKSFWIERQRGNLDPAKAILAQIEEVFARAPETYDVERARYWRARLEAQQGNAAEALTRFEALAREHPATYYGLIARIRVAEQDPARAAVIARDLQLPSASEGPWPLFAGPMGEDPHLLAGVELLRMGFNEAAAQELLAVNRAQQPLESLQLLVQLLSAARDTRAAHAVARSSLRRELTGRITSASRPVWEIAYPNAFRPLIERHCASAGFDPDLLQALMREESALDPRALSWAGALGLTQLMPSTARAVARELKVRHVTTESLLDPDINIKLGAAYLGRLVRRFERTLPHAIASYNAGAAAVDRWRDAGGEAQPLDEWVEEIPISETRGYVKRVLRSYNTYQLLYGRSEPAVSLELPAPGPQRSAQVVRPSPEG